LPLINLLLSLFYSKILQDPACESYSQALLYFKGYHAIQVQRIAHSLWHAGRRVMSLALQSRASEVLAVDIHPAAKIGKGVLLDHGTGVVIGETAEVGNNVSILQNVTLGGTGKQHGDRHPKVSDNVLIGANATILGNIRIGKGAQVAAGSLVLKPVPPKTMVAGSPAKEVGLVSGNPAAKMDQWSEDTPKTGEERTKTVKSNIKNLTMQEKPCEDLFAAPSTKAAAAATPISLPKVVAAAVEKPPVERKAPLPVKPSIETTSVGPPATTSNSNGANVASEKKLSLEAVEAAVHKKEEKSVVVNPTRQGAPPVATGPVEAVTSDKAAAKKWGASKATAADDVEYFI
jgi:serine O-acetyltransferase